MKIEVVKLHEAAKMPIKKRSSDFCYDVYAAWVERLDERTYRYHTGIAVQIARAPEPIEIDPTTGCITGIDFTKSPIQISIDARPRSSVWETGMMLTNCEGTIDEGYTGEICAVFYHYDTTKKPYEAGDRIFQMKLGFTLPIEFEPVSAFVATKANTERGDAGWGSSGRNDDLDISDLNQLAEEQV